MGVARVLRDESECDRRDEVHPLNLKVRESHDRIESCNSRKSINAFTKSMRDFERIVLRIIKGEDLVFRFLHENVQPD